MLENSLIYCKIKILLIVRDFKTIAGSLWDYNIRSLKLRGILKRRGKRHGISKINFLTKILKLFAVTRDFEKMRGISNPRGILKMRGKRHGISKINFFQKV